MSDSDITRFPNTSPARLEIPSSFAIDSISGISGSRFSGIAHRRTNSTELSERFAEAVQSDSADEPFLLSPVAVSSEDIGG